MKRTLLIPLCCLFTASSITAQRGDSVHFRLNKLDRQVEVYVDSTLFTAYCYDPALEKPVLFPVNAPDATAVSRGYPLAPRQKERVDHPHQVGLWFNYGDVNGFDFWNNSPAIMQERKAAYGRIIHRSVEQAVSHGNSAVLQVRVDWMAPDNEDAEKLIEEHTTFVFRSREGHWIVDRITRLTAVAEPLVFSDNKEGMLAIRVDRAFEHPDQSPVILTDRAGKPSGEAVVDNQGVSGWYTNSEGDQGLDVWGKNARWVSLTANSGGKDYSLILMDHPGNLNHPPCWHARGYGLFSVNNLGRSVYNRKLERFELVLNKGESLRFIHRLVVATGQLAIEELESLYSDFISEQD